MKKNLLLFFCAAILAVCFTIPAAKAFLSSSPTKVRTVNVHDRYSISLPTYLFQAYDLNSEASLEYQNTTKEVYIIIIDEPTDDFVKAFKEINEYDSAVSVLDNYVREQMESVRGNMSRVTSESPLRKIQTQTGEASVFDVAGFQEGIKDEMGFTVAFMQGKNCLYMVLTWTFQNSKSVYQNDMNNILASFKELSGAIDTFPHQVKTDKYRVDIPNGFLPDTNACAMNCMGYSRSKGNIYLGITEFEQAEWKKAYKSWPDRKSYSLLEYFALDQKNFQTKIAPQGTTHGELKKGTTNGAPCCTFVRTEPATEENSSWYYEAIIVQGKKHFFYINIFCPIENMPANEADIKAIVDSFKIL